MELHIFVNELNMTDKHLIYNMRQLKQLLSIIAILVLVAASTLSKNNCPANFNMTNANTTVSTSLETLSNFLYSNLYSSSDQAAIQASFTSGNSQTISQYITSVTVLAPFAVIAAAFAITFGIALCCCIFQKSCPPCKSWQRDFSKRPYEKFQLKCVMIFAMIFAGGISLTTIIGFVYFPSLKEYITYTKCGLYTSLDVAINGDQSNGWGGFSQLSNQIGNISTLLNTASTSASTNLANNNWLTTGMDELKQQNINIYKNNYQSTVYTPNQNQTKFDLSGNNPLHTIVPLFISQGLGPNGTANTMVTDIDSGIRTSEKVTLQGYEVYAKSQLLANSANNISVNVNVALQALTQNANYLDAIQVSLTNFSSNLFDSVFNWGLYLIQGILGFVLAASLLILIGILGTHFFELYNCKTMVHLGWVAYGVTYFGVAALCFIFFSFGGISYQFCHFYEDMITNSNSYSNFASITGANSFNRFFQKINTCFYGDGNIMSQFSISKEMQTVSQLYASITKYQNMRDSTTSLYVDLSQSTNKIQGWINAIENYRQGKYYDYDINDHTENNPYVSLGEMNKLTNNQTGGSPPSCTNDYWVFDNVNCTYNATQTIYVSTTSSTSGSTFASTGFMCISFSQKYQSQNNYSWTISDIINRYINRRRCQNNTQSFDTIRDYAVALINYRDSRINLYQNIKDQLSALLAKNQVLNTNITSFTSKVSAFVTATSTLQSLVTNQINGLEASSNCITIANNLRFVYNTFCVNFLYTSVQFGICCLTLLAIMIGGMLTGCVFATRYGRIEKDNKVVRPQTPSIQHLHSQTFQKRKQSSSESSSSDQD